MTATVTDHGLLIGGEHVETGTGPRCAPRTLASSSAALRRGGAEHARRALDAAEAALRDPLPAHERARILDTAAAAARRAARRGRPDRLAEAGQAAQDGAVEAAAGRLDVHVRRGRGAGGSPARSYRWMLRQGRARASSHSRCASRSGSSARSRPSTSRSTWWLAQDCACARGRLRRRAEAGVAPLRCPRSSSRSSRKRPDCPPAGSTSSPVRRLRSATCSSRTSA